MSKKRNTILFILIATLIEVILSILFILLLIIASLFFTKNNPKVLSALLPLSVLCGVLGGMIVYQRLAVWAIKKFNLEEKLDPLLPKRFRKKDRDRKD